MDLADCSDFTVPGCFLDYRIVCHMAGLDASLNNLTPASLRKLFRIGSLGRQLLQRSPRNRTCYSTGQTDVRDLQ